MSRFFPLLFAALAILPAAPVDAQNAAAPSPKTPTLEELQGRLAEIEGDSSLDEATRGALAERYRGAIEALTHAGEFRDQKNAYRQALQEGPAELTRIRADVEALRKAPPPADPPELASGQTADAALALAQTELTALKAQLAESDNEDAAERGRPEERIKRLADAEAALKEATGKTPVNDPAAQPSRGETAAAALALANRAQLEAEIEMLKEEALSEEIRSSLREADRDLLALKIARAEKSVAALQKLAASQLTDEIKKAEALLSRLDQGLPDPVPPPLRETRETVETLITEIGRVTTGIDETGRQLASRERERQRINDAYEGVVGRLELGGLEDTLAQVLLEQLRSLPNRHEGKQRLSETQTSLVTARNGLFELKRAIRGKLTSDEVSEADTPRAATARIGTPALLETGAELSQSTEAAAEVQADLEKKEKEAAQVEARAEALYGEELDSLRAARDSLRKILESRYENWIRLLEEQHQIDREIDARSREFRDFAVEKLFWLRSSPAVGGGTFNKLPEALNYCYGWHRWVELRDRLAAISPAYLLMALFLLLALLIPRRKFLLWLAESGRKTRRISTDRYSHTLVALLLTALLAAPAPLFLGLVGWALLGQPDASDWSFGLGLGLVDLASFLAPATFLMALCRNEGLGEAHFRWDGDTLTRVRRLIFRYLPFYAIPALTLSLVETESTVSYLNGLGRIAGLLLVIASGYLLAKAMHPDKGVAAAIARDNPASRLGRLRKGWHGLIILVTALLAGLLLIGYVFTVLLLVGQFQVSLQGAFAAFVIYGLVLRWFAIRERKLALEELMEKRRARREAARHEESASSLSKEDGTGGEARIPEVKEEEALDISEVGDQTRRLVAFLASAGLAVFIYSTWTRFGPILEALKDFVAFGNLSIADIAITALVLAITISITRNLPGLLEVLVLRQLNLDAGTRNAMITLAKYVVIAIGAVILFRNLGVDWSQFGWIAAALSVGLGFGLQEVVANFISGIILLFERPIRVGDVVTIDGIDGVVSRIQIRATTITNWDRKEFIVPNKQFVTGTLLNWTLSSPVNRVVVVVGAAYGSDTEKAREILLQVAKDHPLIMEDPAPLASFEEFADSYLKLVLRCFLPDMDHRLNTISDLHTEIDKRFRAAGIEIAFPQMDLHIRSGLGGPDGGK